MNARSLLVLAALAGSALLAVAGAVFGVVIEARRSTVALSVMAVALLGTWFITTVQSGVRADEIGSGGSVYSDVVWLVCAVVAGLGAASISLQMRRQRRNHCEKL